MTAGQWGLRDDYVGFSLPIYSAQVRQQLIKDAIPNANIEPTEMQHEQRPSQPRRHFPRPEETVRSEARRPQRPVPPGWSESNDYPSWLPSAPWKIDGDPDDVPRDGKHWEKARKLVEDFDDATITGWKDEVETELLVVRLSFSSGQE